MIFPGNFVPSFDADYDAPELNDPDVVTLYRKLRILREHYVQIFRMLTDSYTSLIDTSYLIFENIADENDCRHRIKKIYTKWLHSSVELSFDSFCGMCCRIAYTLKQYDAKTRIPSRSSEKTANGVSVMSAVLITALLAGSAAAGVVDDQPIVEHVNTPDASSSSRGDSALPPLNSNGVTKSDASSNESVRTRPLVNVIPPLDKKTERYCKSLIKAVPKNEREKFIGLTKNVVPFCQAMEEYVPTDAATWTDSALQIYDRLTALYGSPSEWIAPVFKSDALVQQALSLDSMDTDLHPFDGRPAIRVTLPHTFDETSWTIQPFDASFIVAVNTADNNNNTSPTEYTVTIDDSLFRLSEVVSLNSGKDKHGLRVANLQDARKVGDDTAEFYMFLQYLHERDPVEDAKEAKETLTKSQLMIFRMRLRAASVAARNLGLTELSDKFRTAFRKIAVSEDNVVLSLDDVERVDTKFNIPVDAFAFMRPLFHTNDDVSELDKLEINQETDRFEDFASDSSMALVGQDEDSNIDASIALTEQNENDTTDSTETSPTGQDDPAERQPPTHQASTEINLSTISFPIAMACLLVDSGIMEQIPFASLLVRNTIHQQETALYESQVAPFREWDFTKTLSLFRSSDSTRNPTNGTLQDFLLAFIPPMKTEQDIIPFKVHVSHNSVLAIHVRRNRERRNPTPMEKICQQFKTIKYLISPSPTTFVMLDCIRQLKPSDDGDRKIMGHISSLQLNAMAWMMTVLQKVPFFNAVQPFTDVSATAFHNLQWHRRDNFAKFFHSPYPLPATVLEDKRIVYAAWFYQACDTQRIVKPEFSVPKAVEAAPAAEKVALIDKFAAFMRIGFVEYVEQHFTDQLKDAEAIFNRCVLDPNQFYQQEDFYDEFQSIRSSSNSVQLGARDTSLSTNIDSAFYRLCGWYHYIVQYKNAKSPFFELSPYSALFLYDNELLNDNTARNIIELPTNKNASNSAKRSKGKEASTPIDPNKDGKVGDTPDLLGDLMFYLKRLQYIYIITLFYVYIHVAKIQKSDLEPLQTVKTKGTSSS